MLHRSQQPVLIPRDVRWSPRAPNWYFRLSKPPPLIREDFRPLIEHIRHKGRLDDVSLFGNGDMFDAPIYESDEPPPLDKNAPERLEAQKRFADIQLARKEYLDWYQSEAQRTKRRNAMLKREADREAMRAERLRLQVEHAATAAQRVITVAQRDTEWERAGVSKQAWQQHLQLQAIFRPNVARTPDKKQWETPHLSEISVWWRGGKLLFLEPVWQPKEVDWYRVSGTPVFTVRNPAGYIATANYEAPERDAAMVPLLKACEWLA